MRTETATSARSTSVNTVNLQSLGLPNHFT